MHALVLSLWFCGAVAFVDEPPSLDEIDTTVTEAELADVHGWKKAKRVTKGGDVWLTLHVDPQDELWLSVVEDNQGAVRTFDLGKGAYTGDNNTFDGNTYPGRGYRGDYDGAILFAIRVPGRQLAVWREGRTLKVAERREGGDWRPLVRVRFPRRTRFIPIGTTDPH